MAEIVRTNHTTLVEMALEDEVEALLQQAEVEEAKERTAPRGETRARYTAISEIYGRAVALAEKHSGKDGESTLQIRDRWAISLRKAGSIHDAIRQNSRNVSMYRNTRGQKDPTTLKARQRLAECYVANKQYPYAIKVYELIVKESLDASVEALCHSRSQLTEALYKSGSTSNIARAVNLNIVTLQMAEKGLGTDHAETVKIRHNMGVELMKLGKYSDAASMFKANIKELQACGTRNTQPMPEVTCQWWLKQSAAGLKCCTNVIATSTAEEKKRVGIDEQKEHSASEEGSDVASSPAPAPTISACDGKKETATAPVDGEKGVGKMVVAGFDPRNSRGPIAQDIIKPDVQLEHKVKVKEIASNSLANDAADGISQKDTSPDLPGMSGSPKPRRSDSMELLRPAVSVRTWGRPRSVSAAGIFATSCPEDDDKHNLSTKATDGLKEQDIDCGASEDNSIAKQRHVPKAPNSTMTDVASKTAVAVNHDIEQPTKAGTDLENCLVSELGGEAPIPTGAVPLIRVGTSDLTEDERPVPGEWPRERLRRARSTIRNKHAGLLDVGAASSKQRRASSVDPPREIESRKKDPLASTMPLVSNWTSPE